MPQKTKASAKAKATAKKSNKKDAKLVNPGTVAPVKTELNPAATAIVKAKAALKAAKVTPPVPAKEKTAKSRKISVVASANEASSALSQKWSTLFKKSEQIEAKPYNMKAVFEEKTAIVHKVLGWGYILANRNDRLEVLFKDGIKFLISNYKP